MAESDLQQIVFFGKTELEQFLRYCFAATEMLVPAATEESTRVRFSAEDAAAILCAALAGKPVSGADPQLVHELVAKQAALTPDAIAVVCAEQTVTYRELDEQAANLAQRLKAIGVRPGMRVGLSVERSPEIVVGILGVLKSGAAYVPLDPGYPSAWLDMVLEDIDASVLLTHSKLSGRISGFQGKRIDLDGMGEAVDRGAAEHPGIEPGADDVAYVIYTSGSTGRPKGVEVTHGPLANYIVHASEFFGLGSADRVLQFSSVSFDASVEEIFCPLSRGATLVLRSDVMLSSPADFLAACDQWGITVLDLPTAYWHELTQAIYYDNLRLPDAVRLVVIGGERALPERLDQWLERVGDRVRLCNAYGPTEATIAATMCELSGGAPRGEVSIGRPIPNVEVHIVDQDLHPVEPGVPGELLIGGACLARGYLNRPELTAEKFIPNPFSDVAGSRLYRTGDLAVRNVGGDLTFAGRIDHQVKIRGFRIETEEIEAVLRHHPGVWETVVVAREETGNADRELRIMEGERENSQFAIRNSKSPEKRLVAYVVPRGQSGVTSTELRNFLNGRLPHYMVPSAFVLLNRLPLTVNGKIDRNALPAPDYAKANLDDDYTAPRSPIEETLAAMWAEILRLDRVGIHDNFFDIGGDSLNAAQVLARISNLFHIELSLRRLFEYPTVAGLAAVVIESQTEEDFLTGIIEELEKLPDEEIQQMKIFGKDLPKQVK
ncbi:MAG TPA: non-ribosomal peptide synthetase [Candidatus Eisenbacteria bacterium]|nr:non-ribosomal peptide synthetase [Candidatus Eisenbacteria bacterium]